MAFSPFTKEDFKLMGQVKKKSVPEPLKSKINELRNELCEFPEFKLEYFKKHIVRKMKIGRKKVFGYPRGSSEHWFLYNVGGDQDQVQLNIGMRSEYIRVGLAFQIGRQIDPKPPAFRILQTFLGVRPPLPFRHYFYKCIKYNGFAIEYYEKENDKAEGGWVDNYYEIIDFLETHMIPHGTTPVFIFIGKLWHIDEAITKTATDFRNVFNKLMPFYEELILAGGRYEFHPPVSGEA